MTLLHKVVVGSRLHGLYNETSDYDYRGIFIHPLIDILSPFKTVKNTSWIEGDVDNTSFELRDFCKYATKGNPTILEILWSNMVEETSADFIPVLENKSKFLSSKAIFDAHRGYAHNQYKKMNLFAPDQRTPKFAVAYIRALIQGIDLLETGEIQPQIGEEKDFLMDVKYNYSNDMVPELSKKFIAYETKITNAYYKNVDRFTPDIDWIEQYIYTMYKKYL